MTTRETRITLNIKLTVGRDDDLIAWLVSLPRGERQASAKQLLREAVQRQHGDNSHLAQIGEDTAWVRAALTELPTWMEALLSRFAVNQLAQAIPQAAKPTRTGQLSADGVTRREKRIAKATW
jgi:hypothetical protein